MGDSSPAKICVVCKQDCSKKPRTKDSAGHYTCAECAKKASAPAKTSAPKPAARPAAAAVGGDDDAIMGALLADVSVASANRCENCGTAMEKDALLCVRCGFDSRTGRVHSVSVQSAPKESKVGKAAGGLASAGGAVVKSDGAAFLLGIGLSVLGGALAAGLWVYIASSVDLRSRTLLKLLALLIGFGAGGGMFIGARHMTSTLTGVIAAFIALMSCIGAHVALIQTMLEPIVEQVRAEVRVTDEYAIAYLGQSVAQSHEFRNVVWDEDVDPAHAWTEAVFPEEIWKAAKSRYEALDVQRKADHRELTQQAMDAEFEAAVNEAVEEGASWIGFGDIIGIAMAIVIAFMGGSKEL